MLSHIAHYPFLISFALVMASSMSCAAQGYAPCSKDGLFGSTALCCSNDVIGGVALGCLPPDRIPSSPIDFMALCGPKKPKCCFEDPTGGSLNVICHNPVGF
jgi:hypothetical protein